jgi:hypothetical protein
MFLSQFPISLFPSCLYTRQASRDVSYVVTPRGLLPTCKPNSAFVFSLLVFFLSLLINFYHKLAMIVHYLLRLALPFHQIIHNVQTIL